MCSVAPDRSEYLAALRVGRSGISTIDQLDVGWLPVDIAGQIKDLDPVALAGDPLLTRADALAVLATEEALQDARVDLGDFVPSRVGVSIGTCQGNITEVFEAAERRHHHRVLRSSADVVAERFGARGPRFLVTNACAAGAAAVAVAVEKLLHDEIDLAIVGGTDELQYFTMAGFSTLQSLDPRPCSPYSRSEGLTVGEGAGILILERVTDAARRGVHPVADLLGFGLSADGYHPTAPDPTGRGAALAMRRALEHAGLSPDDVDYVNGHGTGTAANDAMERNALKVVFGAKAPSVPMSSTKSMIGHLLGAAGAVEAIACVLAAQHDLLPPTINVPDGAEPGLDCVPNAARPAPVRVALSNNYAFGGSNASLVIGKPGGTPAAQAAEAAAPPDRRVVVTGIGCVGAPGLGIDEWRARFGEGQHALAPLEFAHADGTWGGLPPKLQARGLAASDQWRKMDELARLSVASARGAWADSAFDLGSKERDEVGVILATACGALDLSLRFEIAARRGKGQAPAKDFPHTSMNSAAGHVCTVLGLHGPMLSISNAGTAGLSALSFSADLIRSGRVERMLVTAVDELTPSVVRAARLMGTDLSLAPSRPFDRHADGTSLGCASVTLAIETLESARDRGAHVYGELLAVATLGAERDRTIDEAAWVAAFNDVLARAGVDAGSVGYCAAAAAGVAEDAAEAAALGKVFATGTAVGAPKSIAGDCFGSSGLVNVVAALLAVDEGLLTPVAGLEEPLEGVDLDFVRSPTTRAVDVAMANAIASGSAVSAAVFARA